MNNIPPLPVRDDSTLVSWSFDNVFALVERKLPGTPEVEHRRLDERLFSVDHLERNITMTAKLHLPSNQITTASLTFRWFTQADRHRKDDDVQLSNPIDVFPEEKFVPKIIPGDEVMWMDAVDRLFSEDQLAKHVVTRLVSGRRTSQPGSLAHISNTA